MSIITKSHRELVNELPVDQFASLLRKRLGPIFGAAICSDGSRRIWRQDGLRRQFVVGHTWTAALIEAWKRWQWDVPGAEELVANRSMSQGAQ